MDFSTLKVNLIEESLLISTIKKDELACKEIEIWNYHVIKWEWNKNLKLIQKY